MQQDLIAQWRSVAADGWPDCKAPPGPWDYEEDRYVWTDGASGLPCLVLRHPGGGHLCGYVAVPVGHPAYGVGREALALPVHGGLTYHGPCPSPYAEDAQDGNLWWLGFDTSHAGDMLPRMVGWAVLRAKDPTELMDQAALGYSEHTAYRTAEYVRGQCTLLADGLNDMQCAAAQAGKVQGGWDVL